MSPAEISGTIIGLVLVALFSVIATLLKSQFNELGFRLGKVETILEAHSTTLVALTVSQKAVTENQTKLSGVHNRLLDEIDELEGVTEELQFATKALQDRWKNHEEFQRAIAEIRQQHKTED